jgi:hypothetical protein
MLMPLLDNLLAPHTGVTAQLTWWLTIGPHELGHLLCLPFGEFITFAGGSVWQILFWLLIGLYTLLIRKHVTSGLMALMVMGHSFINMSVYIRDARTRELELLFGLDKSRHDWWNLLDRAGLLPYDHWLAGAAVVLGALIVCAVILLGLLTTWLLPRTALGRRPRFEGSFFRAVAERLAD